jgi:hypothetical protein
MASILSHKILFLIIRYPYPLLELASDYLVILTVQSHNPFMPFLSCSDTNNIGGFSVLPYRLYLTCSCYLCDSVRYLTTVEYPYVEILFHLNSSLLFHHCHYSQYSPKALSSRYSSVRRSSLVSFLRLALFDACVC